MMATDSPSGPSAASEALRAALRAVEAFLARTEAEPDAWPESGLPLPSLVERLEVDPKPLAAVLEILAAEEPPRVHYAGKGPQRRYHRGPPRRADAPKYTAESIRIDPNPPYGWTLNGRPVIPAKRKTYREWLPNVVRNLRVKEIFRTAEGDVELVTAALSDFDPKHPSLRLPGRLVKLSTPALAADIDATSSFIELIPNETGPDEVRFLAAEEVSYVLPLVSARGQFPELPGAKGIASRRFYRGDGTLVVGTKKGT